MSSQQEVLWTQWETALAVSYDDTVKVEIENIRTRLKRTADDIIAIGNSLIAIKDSVGHGQFIPLLKAEFDMSIDSAQDFMRVARKVAEKNWNIQHLPTSVIYEISSKSMPDEIAERVISGDISPTVAAIRTEKTKAKLDAVIDIVDSYPPEKRNAFNPSPGERDNEWYTGAKYIDAAREVMGSIDLDPASCEMANLTVKASRYYTKEEDGLNNPWVGNCWVNPPYGREGGKSMIYAFIEKLIREYSIGNVQQAIILTPADTDERWFQLLWDYPICFASHKLSFDRPDQTKSRQFFGTAFAYIGHDRERFIDIFEQFGPIAARICKGVTL